MPIIGLTLDATKEYVSTLDSAKGTEEATVFVLGTLDSRVFGMLRDKGTTIHVDPNSPNDDVATSINMNEVAFQTVQYGLRGWRNLKDGKGEDIKFKTVKRNHGGQSYAVADPDVIKRLPQAIISELSEEIRRENELSADEAKN
jgi:hypothetical protein